MEASKLSFSDDLVVALEVEGIESNTSESVEKAPDGPGLLETLLQRMNDN